MPGGVTQIQTGIMIREGSLSAWQINPCNLVRNRLQTVVAYRPESDPTPGKLPVVPLFIPVQKIGMVNTNAGLIIPVTFSAFGIFLLRQFYIGIPIDLPEAAIIDGASYWGIYWNIMLPLSRPILSAMAVFFFLGNWNAFLWPLTITTDQNLWLVQLGIASFQNQYSASWNYIMAASVVVAVPTLVLFFLFQRQLVESIKTSGIK